MSEQLLPIRCPKCTHDQVRLYVSSVSVLTVTCPECAFTWAIEVASLAPPIKEQIAKTIHEAVDGRLSSGSFEREMAQTRR